MMKRSNAKYLFSATWKSSFKIWEEKKLFTLIFYSAHPFVAGPLKRTMTDDPQKRVNSWHVRVFISLSICPPGKETNTLYGTVFFFPKCGETTIGCNRPISNSICTLGQVRFDYFVLLLTLTTFTFKFRVRVECEWDVRGFFYIIFNDMCTI